MRFEDKIPLVLWKPLLESNWKDISFPFWSEVSYLHRCTYGWWSGSPLNPWPVEYATIIFLTTNWLIDQVGDDFSNYLN